MRRPWRRRGGGPLPTDSLTQHLIPGPPTPTWTRRSRLDCFRIAAQPTRETTNCQNGPSSGPRLVQIHQFFGFGKRLRRARRGAHANRVFLQQLRARPSLRAQQWPPEKKNNWAPVQVCAPGRRPRCRSCTKFFWNGPWKTIQG